VTFQVSSNGRKVLNFKTRLGYDGKCGQGGGPSYEVHASPIAIGRTGRFTATTRGVLGPFHATVVISGRIRGREASGTLEVPGLHCATGAHPGANPYFASFTAHAR
jgi:hypothetical protein